MSRNGMCIRYLTPFQDLLKFDIVPEKIQSGEDTRTTAMASVPAMPNVCFGLRMSTLLIARLGDGEEHSQGLHDCVECVCC